MPTHHLPSFRVILKETFAHIRTHGKRAVLPLVVLSVILGTVVGTMLFAVLRYASFSEGGSPEDALRMAAILVPCFILLLGIAMYNWVWIALWARKHHKNMPTFWRAFFPLIGLYVLYKIAAAFPGIVLGVAAHEAYIPLVQVLMVLWTIFLLSRGSMALLLVSRDGVRVFEAIRKSFAATVTCWPAVAVRLVLGWLLYVLCAVAVIALAVVVRVFVDMPDLVTAGIAAVLLIVLAQIGLLCSLSFLQRLAEAVEKSR